MRSNFFGKGPILFLLILMGSNSTLLGQELRNPYGDVYFDSNLYQTKYQSPEGSPYMNLSFIPARINETPDTHLVRFDMVEGQMEVMTTSERVVVVDNSKPFRFSFLDGSDRVFETVKVLDEKGNLQNVLLEKVSENDDFSLFKRQAKTFVKAVKAQGYAAAKPAHFKTVRDVFFVSALTSGKDSGYLIPLPDRLKPFVELFGENASEIRAFIKDNKYKLDNQDHLKVIFLHYYSL